MGAAGVSIHVDCIEGIGRALAEADGAFDRELDRRGVEVRTAVKLHAFPQMKGPGDAVFAHLPVSGKTGRQQRAPRCRAKRTLSTFRKRPISGQDFGGARRAGVEVGED